MKKTLKLSMVALLTLSTFSGLGTVVQAEGEQAVVTSETLNLEQPEQLGKEKNEGWNVPNVSLGNGLTDIQKQETLELLGLFDKDAKDNLVTPVYNEPVIINGDDLVKYVTDLPKDTFNSNSKAFSSGVITRKDKGFGVQVEKVADKNGKVNITRDASVFRNAAITSGIYDAEIKIGSVVPMDGSGALAGIYKIYDEIEQPTGQDAEDLQAKRGVAQEEMAVTSEIIDANKDKEDFSPENLAVALADIKIELQKINGKLDKMEEESKKQAVNEVVTKNLEKNGLNEVIEPQQIEALTTNMVSFANSPAINDKEMTKQLGLLKEDIVKNGEGFIKDLGDNAKGFFGRMWEGIKNFFSNLFGGNKEKTVETTPKETVQSETLEVTEESDVPQTETQETVENDVVQSEESIQESTDNLTTENSTNETLSETVE